MLRYHWVAAAAVWMGWLLNAMPALALGQPCDRLFVPEGYELTCTVERLAGDDAWEVSVHPTDGAFSSLSELTLSPIDGPIADPKMWLREQVRIDVSGVEEALTSFLDDEDSPFAEESWWNSLKSLRDMVYSISDLPLDSCDDPREADGAAWVIDCAWGIGSFHQLLTIRLVERDGVYYGLHVQSMNERRHRHLQAIANSF